LGGGGGKGTSRVNERKRDGEGKKKRGGTGEEKGINTLRMGVG
jgi:hypothetical protein